MSYLTALSVLLGYSGPEPKRTVNPGTDTDAGAPPQDSGMSQMDAVTSQMDVAMPVEDAGQGSQSPDIGTMIPSCQCEDEPVANHLSGALCRAFS